MYLPKLHVKHKTILDFHVSRFPTATGRQIERHLSVFALPTRLPTFHASPQLLATESRGHLLYNAITTHTQEGITLRCPRYDETHLFFHSVHDMTRHISSSKVSTIRRDTYHSTGPEGTSPLGDAKRRHLPAICTGREDQTPGIPSKQEGVCYFTSLFGSLEIALGFVYVLHKK